MTDHLYREIAKLRQQLDEAKATIADMRKDYTELGSEYFGIAGMTRTQAKIAAMLVTHGRVATERLYLATHDGGPRPDNELSDKIRTQISVLRKRLKPHGITFHCVYSFGYEMTVDSRERLMRLARMPCVESPSLCPMEQAA